MITRIREVRRARGLTLDEVAQRCNPPTTPQTIGRLETGTRTVSVGWLNRIADALGVDAADLVESGESKAEVPVAAVVGAGGAGAPRRTAILVPPRPRPGDVGVTLRQVSEITGPVTRSGARRFSRKSSDARSTATCSYPAPPAASSSGACSAGKSRTKAR